MWFSPQPHRRLQSGRESYATRLLLGYVASLAVLLGIVHLPIPLRSADADWLLASSSDYIHVDRIQEASPDDPSSSLSSPPRTRRRLPSPNAPPEGPGQDAPSDTGERSASPTDSSDTPVRSVAALSDGRRPRVVGGMGHYYLQIQYPAAARHAGIEGQVRLQFVVTTDGHPRDIRVVQPLHPLCDSAAVRALRSVRFRPAMQSGDPVPVRMTLPVRFRLVDDSTGRTADDAPSGPKDPK